MKTPRDQKGPTGLAPPKPVWQRPAVTKVGSFGDIMQGGSFNQPDGGGNMKKP